LVFFFQLVFAGSTLAYTVDVHISKESVFNQIKTVQLVVSTNITKINKNISLNKNLDIKELRDNEMKYCQSSDMK